MVRRVVEGWATLRGIFQERRLLVYQLVNIDIRLGSCQIYLDSVTFSIHFIWVHVMPNQVFQLREMFSLALLENWVVDVRCYA